MQRAKRSRTGNESHEATQCKDALTTEREKLSQKLAGKVAVITGGSSGIGLATAQRFVNEGAYVFVTGRRQTELDAAMSQIGQNVTGVQGDVSKLADLDRLYATVTKEKGKLDIFFANAGTGGFGPIGQITEEDSTNSSTST
jgi:NAD(P)-dependent dehydrogenase (short-subunit alcohol dehydrogenase family)